MKSRGAFLFVAGSLSWAVAQWFLVWLFARFAGGAVAVGEYSIALAVTTPVFILGHFGLRTVYLTLRETHPWTTYLRLRISGIALSAGLILGYVLFTTTGDPWIWYALLFQKSVDSYLDLLYGRLQRENRLMQIGLLGLTKTLGTIVVAAAVILITQSVFLAIFGSGLVSTAVTIFARRVALGTKEDNSTSEPESGYREILRAALPTTITEGLASVSTYLPFLFLAVIADEAVAGTFTTAAYLFSVANIAGGILKNVLITSLRLTFENDGIAQLFRRSHQIAGILGLIGLVATPIVIFAGSAVLEFLYGGEFNFSYGELSILAFAALSIAPAYIYSALLNVINRYDSQVLSFFGALILGVVAGVVMVLTSAVSAMIIALGVAFAANWGRLLGVLILTISVQFRRT